MGPAGDSVENAPEERLQVVSPDSGRDDKCELAAGRLTCWSPERQSQMGL
jgi:hypothetical protein